MGYLTKCALIAAIVVAASAQTCCNIDSQCPTGISCVQDYSCITDPAYYYVCGKKHAGSGSPFDDYLNDGWTRSGDYVYKRFTDKVNYETATAKCVALKGQLAAEVLRDAGAVSHMHSAGFAGVYATYDEAPWVGYKQQSNCDWVWVDGGSTNPDTCGWDEGEPNNAGGHEDCGQLVKTTAEKAFLNDLTCTKLTYYICEIRVIH